MMDFDRIRSRFKLASAQLEQDPVELFEKQAGLKDLARKAKSWAQETTVLAPAWNRAVEKARAGGVFTTHPELAKKVPKVDKLLQVDKAVSQRLGLYRPPKTKVTEAIMDAADPELADMMAARARIRGALEKQAGLGAWVVKKLEESEAPSAYVGQAAQLSGLPEEDVRSYVRNIRPHRFGVPAEQFAKDIKPVWAMKAEKYNPLHQKLTATAAGSPEEAAFLKQHGKSLDNHHNAWVGGQSDLRKKYTGGDSIGMWANPEKLKVKTSAVFGGGGFDGGMPQMPAMSVAGNMGGAKFVGFTGRGGRGRRVGSDAGASMVARHQADMMMAGMMQQNEFSKAYASALGRMSRGGGRVKLSSAKAKHIPGVHPLWTAGSIGLGAGTGSLLGYMSGGKDSELARRNAALGGLAGAGAGGLGALAFNRSHKATEGIRKALNEDMTRQRQALVGDLETSARGVGKNIESSLGGVVDRARVGLGGVIDDARAGIKQDAGEIIDRARAGVKQDAGEVIDRARAGVKSDMSDLISGDLAKQREALVGGLESSALKVTGDAEQRVGRVIDKARDAFGGPKQVKVGPFSMPLGVQDVPEAAPSPGTREKLRAAYHKMRGE